jgi:hypothetical protein
MYPNQDLTIHSEQHHTDPRSECEYCDGLMWGDVWWPAKELETYADAMNADKDGNPKHRYIDKDGNYYWL